MLENKPRTEELVLDFQNYVEHPPITTTQMYQAAVSNDTVTIDSWKDTWIGQTKQNHKKFGPFKDRGLGKLFGSQSHKPAIIVGSGPSLGYNGKQLKDRGSIALVSCLHNYHFFVDNDIDVDLFVTLDAGPVTIEEVSEGGTHSEQYYWDSTKGKTLAAFIGTHPTLLEKWQGEVLFFNCPIPSPEIEKAFDETEQFHTYVSTGGNVLGASFYIARGIMGANPICFVGADFSFSYKGRFHGWDSKYDANIGRYINAIDIYGNKVKTWQSYLNFKSWFDAVCLRMPGLYVNCTEGGLLGSYPDGNIMAIKQMRLTEFINMYEIHNEIREQCLNPETGERKILV